MFVFLGGNVVCFVFLMILLRKSLVFVCFSPSRQRIKNVKVYHNMPKTLGNVGKAHVF